MIDNSGKAISSAWSKATKEDIGSGFRRASSRVSQEFAIREQQRQRGQRGQRGNQVDNTYEKFQRAEFHDKHTGRPRHPFMNGNSKHVFYLIRPPKLRVVKRQKFVAPINAHNIVTPDQRVKFASALGTNIDKTSKFFLEEILPRTEALITGLTNVDEVIQQLTDEKAALPVEFIKNKAREAVQLRIIRFICQQYGLTKGEGKLMCAEYIAKMKPALF